MMKKTEKSSQRNPIRHLLSRGIASAILVMMFSLISGIQSYAHCDSYDGPVIKEALTALKTNNVNLILKWIYPEQEQEITSLFKKTIQLKKGDQEVYAIVEKHFLETLVRLHRETEGEPYTGLKPLGSVTPIIKMADQSLEKNNITVLSSELTAHIEQVVKEKYEKAMQLSKTKDESVQKGREYVAAYVDYTHTLEGIHAILEHGPGDHGH